MQCAIRCGIAVCCFSFCFLIVLLVAMLGAMVVGIMEWRLPRMELVRGGGMMLSRPEDDAPAL